MKGAIGKIIGLSIIMSVLLNCTSEAQDNQETKKELQELEKDNSLKQAYFASGCFWCVEAIYESVKGVKEVISGYSGGKTPNPTYQLVGSHRTRHAEAVAVFYDPKQVSFETLVKVFYGSQDPTTVGQKPDFGDSYRSIIFYQSAEEKQIAEKAKTAIASKYNQPIVTEILAFDKFWPAEDYHQNYEKLNPNQPYVRGVSVPRLNLFKSKFPELLK